MKHGFVKVAAAVPFVRVADCQYNIERIERMIHQAESQGVEILALPELCITGYTCADLFLQPFLIEEAEHALLRLVERTASTRVMVLVGMPVRVEEKLFNAAVAFQSGSILGAIPKTYLPNYREFQEARWFSPAKDLQFTLTKLGGFDVPIGHNVIFRAGEVAIGIEICEDMWTPYTPGTRLALYGAQIIFNLSASNESIGKHNYLRSLISGLSSQNLCGYVYCSCGYGESSTDLVYTGKAFVAEIGRIVEEMPRFVYEERLLVNDIDVSRIQSERLCNSSFRASVSDHTQRGLLTEIPFVLRSAEESQQINRHIESNPFLPADQRSERCQEVIDMQICALSQRLRHIGAQHVVIGVSGGLDSTLALLSTVATFDFLGLPREQVIGVTMPGLGTSARTLENALSLMHLLGVTSYNIDIRPAVERHFADIGHDPQLQDLTYENSQARERTQILMDLGNRFNAPVIGTGDLSELALGWCTYGGDHISMYSVNAGLPKTSIQYILRHLIETNAFGVALAPVLHSILETPISPELKPTDQEGQIAQHTEATVGPYELHDFFIYNFLSYGFTPSKIQYLAHVAFEGKYSAGTIKRWMREFYHRFFTQQFKRNCMPDGPKVSRISLSPRGDWRMPSDAVAKAWLAEIEALPEEL
ncbi:NAD(+) synthase [Porphyromonas sp. COT-239 OH1446]|uniref:NAD(+) synthase n=1 Tax=Porphyromonas sp. COT-239 OH1446 TaxID=1515613 RepID=UPI00052C4CBE|nr:NAD(+) synthase [Porphyromonas sp. COT-239 OH1446]KGN68406.1 NAD synthetase [Porphyromonas sp. COT-239 OH1446]